MGYIQGVCCNGAALANCSLILCPLMTSYETLTVLHKTILLGEKKSLSHSSVSATEDSGRGGLLGRVKAGFSSSMCVSYDKEQTCILCCSS